VNDPDQAKSASIAHIDFNARAELRKWLSLGGLRNSNVAYPNPYLLAEGTLEECIQEFMTKASSARDLYEIHTSPQADIVIAVMSAEHIVELARLREFL
jgi:hypothetical protein